MSRSNVSSTEIETRSASSSRSRGSIPQRAVAQQRADRPGEDDAELGVAEGGEIADRLHAGRREPHLRLRPDPGQRAHRERSEEPRLLPRRHDRDPARLAAVGGDLADDLRRRDAERARERRRGADRRLHRLGDGPRTGERGDDRAEVEVALVDPDLLDPWHDLADRAPHRLRVLPVERMARPDEDDVGAAPERLGRAHRRADAEAPGDVVRRRDDAAALRVAADDERLRAQRRVFELLDGGEERVEVEMGEDRHALERYGAAVITALPPPPAIEQPAPYQVSYGVVAGIAAPGNDAA